MMLTVLSTVYSLPFAIGAVVGFMFRTIYCHAKARWLDRNYPRSDGSRHPVEHISRVWIAGLVAVLSVGYGIYSSEKLSSDVHRCWSEQYNQTKANIDINAQNDGISRKQQDLQREYDRDTSDWLKALVTPPGDLANQETNSPARQAWGIQVTLDYQDKLNKLGARFDDLVHQRQVLDQERAEHKLPESVCGK